MQNIKITVTDKRATLAEAARIVCGNSDYTVTFAFDDKWAVYSVKTARFKYKVKGLSRYVDVVFSGDTCQVPVLTDTEKVHIGVYAGDLQTTTAASVPCALSILCGDPVHDEPPEDVYRQIVALCDEANASAEQAAKDAAQAEPYALQAQAEAIKAEDAAKSARESANEATAQTDTAIEKASKAILAAEEAEGFKCAAEAAAKSTANVCANALKGTASGEIVALRDVSPVEHDIQVRVSNGDNAKIIVCGKNIVDTEAFFVADNWMKCGTFGGSYNNAVFPLNLRSNTTYTLTWDYNETIPQYLFLDSFPKGEPLEHSKEKTEKYLTAGGAPVFTHTFTTTDDKDYYLFLGGFATYLSSLAFFQVEVGDTATAYEPYQCAEYEQGQAVKSIYPTTTITTDTEGALVDVEYNKDLNKAFESLVQAIISLGGHV